MNVNKPERPSRDPNRPLVLEGFIQHQIAVAALRGYGGEAATDLRDELSQKFMLHLIRVAGRAPDMTEIRTVYGPVEAENVREQLLSSLDSQSADPSALPDARDDALFLAAHLRES